MSNTKIKIIVEEHPDVFVAYPLGGIKGAVVGQGDTLDEAINDLLSAIREHVKTFGPEVLLDDSDTPILNAYVMDREIA